MKKVPILSSIFILTTLIATSYSTVLAKELLFPEDLLINSEDFGDINNLKPEILEMANCFNDDGFHAELSDIKIDEAYCVYVNANILENTPETIEDISELTGEADKVWNIPVVSNGNTVIVQVSIAKPLDEENMQYLTDEQIEEINKNEGTWQPVASTLYSSSEITQNNFLSAEVDEELYKTVLIGGEPGIQSLLAVILEKDAVAGVVSLQRDISYSSTENTSARMYPSTQILEKGKMYSLTEFADASINISSENFEEVDSTSGYSSTKFISYEMGRYFIGLLIVILPIIIIQIKKHIGGKAIANHHAD